MKPGEAEDILEASNLVLKERFAKASSDQIEVISVTYGYQHLSVTNSNKTLQTEKSAIRYSLKVIALK